MFDPKESHFNLIVIFDQLEISCFWIFIVQVCVPAFSAREARAAFPSQKIQKGEELCFLQWDPFYHHHNHLYSIIFISIFARSSLRNQTMRQYLSTATHWSTQWSQSTGASRCARWGRKKRRGRFAASPTHRWTSSSSSSSIIIVIIIIFIIITQGSHTVAAVAVEMMMDLRRRKNQPFNGSTDV